MLGSVALYAQKSFGDEHFHKGDTFLLFNRHDSSMYHFRRAKANYEQVDYWRGVIASNNKIAENLCGVFELKEAMRMSKEAFKMAHERLGEWDIEKANAMNNIGNIHYLTGQHEMALKEYEKALELANHEVHEEVLFSAPSSLGIGNVYFGKNQYKEAFKHFKTALEANIRLLGENHPYVANSYLSLGNLYRNKGSYNLATEYYDKALEINIEVFGEGHPDVATTYVGIADIYKSESAYELAMQYYRQALVIYEEFLHEKNPKFGAIYLGFADVYKNKGNYDKALEYYQKALDLFSQTIGLEHQSSVRSFLGVGNTYMYQEEFRAALDYYNKVLDINFNLVGENHINSSAANNNLGSIYYFFGDFALSTRFFSKALAIDISIHGEKHPNVANGHYNLSRVYGEQGNIAKALASCQNAINASIMGFDDKNVFSNPVLVNFFDNKDLLWYLQYKGELLEEGFSRSANVKGLDISLHSFVLSDSLVDQIRQSYTERRDQVELSKMSNKIYESSVNASYALINLLNEENVKYLGSDVVYEEKKREYENRFFFFTEKNKGAILFSSLAESNANSFGGIPDELLIRETELKTMINSYTQELSANPDPEMTEYYQRELFKATREYEEMIVTFETEYPKYYDLKYDVQVADLDDMTSYLDDSTMMLSYFVTADSLYATQIDNRGMRIAKTYKRRDYEKYVKALRKGMIFKSDKIYAKYARALYLQLFPEEIPDYIKNIVVIQDGVMSTIPFEVLLTKDVYSDSLNYSTLPYLLRDYNISYSFSANLLYKTFMNNKVARPKAEKEGIVVAPINFEHSIAALKAAKKRAYEDADKAKNLRRGISIPTSELKSLPGTEVESNEIDSLFTDNNKNADKFIYYQAQEALAKSGTMNEYKYVHIASHGFVNQDEPEFSGIFMTSDTLTQKEDGILFSGEIYNISLNAELVTLSACETGLGKISDGEGIIGLTRALIYAGAKNLAVSLWKVSDESTKELMIDFYGNFLSEDVPENINESLSYAYALKKAKLDMIERGGEFSLPYYWSPFVLLGK